MSKAFVPSFKAKKINVAFSTNNPLGTDRKSLPVTIVEPRFNEFTRSIEIDCSDRKTRQCRIDRFTNEKDLKSLQDRIQKAYDSSAPVVFVAAGGNDPNVYFYNILDSI